MTHTPAVPDGLPIISAGSHIEPGEGACIMEFCSILAGEEFTAEPECTHEALAAVARQVNDGMQDRNRHLLLPLIPRLIGTRPAITDYDQRAAVAWALAKAATAWQHVKLGPRSVLVGGSGSPILTRCASFFPLPVLSSEDAALDMEIAALDMEDVTLYICGEFLPYVQVAACRSSEGEQRFDVRDSASVQYLTSLIVACEQVTGRAPETLTAEQTAQLVEAVPA